MSKSCAKWFRHILPITVMFSTSSSNTTSESNSSNGISGLEKQVNDICKMLTKTVSEVANVYDQNTNLLGYKSIVGQVVSGLPQYQEMECENRRLVAENTIAKQRISDMTDEILSLKEKLAEFNVENVKLEIEEVVVADQGQELVVLVEASDDEEGEEPEQELVEVDAESDQELVEVDAESDQELVEVDAESEQELVEVDAEAEQELVDVESDESDAEQELVEAEVDAESEEGDSDIELEEIEIDGKMYFVEVGADDEARAIFDITGEDEIGDEIGFMLDGEAEFDGLVTGA